MPTVLLAQVRFSALTQKTEDDITNSWHFQVETLPPASQTLTDLTTALQTFYTALSSDFVADWSNQPHVKYYNLADPIPRAPLTSQTMTLAALGTSGKAVPRELASVLSYAAAPLSGVDMKRRRGHVYLPTVTNGNLDNDGRFITGWLTKVKNAAAALLTASDAAADWTWVVYSRVLGTASPVVRGFVDNAPDIQRRRGIDASARQTFP